jgi:CheY-like chemotaxis protein
VPKWALCSLRTCESVCKPRNLHFIIAEVGSINFFCVMAPTKSKPSKASVTENAARPTILFLEDSPFSIEPALNEAHRAGFSTHIATTIDQARDYLKKNSAPTAIVVDLILSHDEPNNGLNFVSEIRRSKASHTPVIVHSAYLHGIEEDLGKLNVQAVIDKAQPPRSLIHTIRSLAHLSKAQSERELQERKVRPRTRRTNIVKRERPDALAQVRQAVVEELNRLVPVKARHLEIPGEGTFELIKPLIGFKADIEKRLMQFDYGKNVFLMMKLRSTNTDLSDYIIETLKENGLRGVRADQHEWNITKNVYNPIAVLYCCKFGIALFDEPEEKQAFSPNVAYELGIMHHQNKNCLILKHRLI